MSAKDYEIAIGWTRTPYLAKILKKSNTMSVDRRVIEDNEVLALFENYLRRWTETHHDEILIVTVKGQPIFEAKLLEND